jgi:UTP--glucose-1-phosphate uridylyltransferase
MRLMCRREGLYGLRFKGRRYDIGSKADWLRATLELSMEREDLAEELRGSYERLIRKR